MDQDVELDRQLAEICDKFGPTQDKPEPINYQTAVEIVKDHIKQGRADMVVDPETNSTKTLIYCVLGDNSERVKQMNELCETHRKETHLKLSFKTVSQRIRSASNGLLTSVMAVDVPDPSIGDIVSKEISYADFTKNYPQFGYNNWEKLLVAGLSKQHVIDDEWITAQELLDLCGDYHKLFSNLIDKLDFDAEDFLCSDAFGNGAVILRMRVTYKHLLEIGLDRDILLSDRCKLTLSVMVKTLRLTLDVLENVFKFDRSSFAQLIKLKRIASWSEFQQLFGKDPKLHFKKKSPKPVKLQILPKNSPVIPQPPAPRSQSTKSTRELKSASGEVFVY